jgi:hypothetical protein
MRRWWFAVALRALRFFALLAVALILGLAFCHVMEIPGKLRLSGPEWLTVQQHLYVAFGAPLGGPLELLAVLLAWILVFAVRQRGPAFPWTLAAALLVSAGLAAWFALVAPLNAVIAGWAAATLPSDWIVVRNRWELGHAVHCLFWLLGFGALAISILRETPVLEMRHRIALPPAE